MNILAVIPAKGSSNRLPNKNTHIFLGKPMLLWAADECKKSKKINRIVVSTECSNVKKICETNSLEVVDRHPNLSKDDVPKMDVIRDAVKTLSISGYSPDIVISLQPNSPEVKAKDLDDAIDFFNENNLHEVISINPDMIQNACFRIMSFEATFRDGLSVYMGVFKTNYIDIHSKPDVYEAEKRVKNILEKT
tara:strand:- start:1103 stop:1678 length:576 start_codon:yes stop_codon:yes gene_type:complete